MLIKRNKDGKILPKRFTMDRIEQAMDDMGGFCLACGEEAYGVEPDARKYACEACDLNQVYGASEILLMGRVDP